MELTALWELHTKTFFFFIGIRIFIDTKFEIIIVTLRYATYIRIQGLDPVFLIAAITNCSG